MNILDVALAALKDDTSLGANVLADYILETGWDDERVWALIDGWLMDECRLGRGYALAHPNEALVRAVVAVLLFGEWPTTWPLIIDWKLRIYYESLFSSLSSMSMTAAMGEGLDRLARGVFGIVRNGEESDKQLRARLNAYIRNPPLLSLELAESNA